MFAAIRRASSLLIWFAACVNSFIKAEHVFDGIRRLNGCDADHKTQHHI
jgi:hypothetical protein